METSAQSEHADESASQGITVPQRDPAEVKAYNQSKRRVHIADIVVSLVYWIGWCLLAETLVTGLWPEGGSRWPALAVVALVMLGGGVLVSLPIGYFGSYVLEQRFELSNQTPWSWLLFEIKTWLVGAIIGGITLAGLYGALWYGGPLWGVWVWLGVMVLSILLAKVFPLVILPLFYPSRPLERPALAERLKDLAGEAGMTITGIFDLELSKDTKKANAMLAGLGASRRVYLSDTLLGAFEDDEIAVVFAHELGHHVRGHIWKMIGLSAVVTSLLVALIYWRLNPFAGNDPSLWPRALAGLSQVMLLVTVFPLVTGPATNAILRRFERQCDSDALRLTGNPDAYRSTFGRLGQLNLDDLNPPLWEVIMFDDHPPLAERIAMADRADH